MSVLYILLYIVTSVQSINFTDLNNPLSNGFGELDHHSLRNLVDNKNNIWKSSLLIEDINSKRHPRNASEVDNTSESTLNRLKHVLSKFLFSKDKLLYKREVSALSDLISSKKKRKLNEPKTSENSQKWYNWTKWSPCSVTCGKGREIRWRHCKEDCKDVEIEMEEKSCQLPACPQKLFGIINL